MYDCFAPDLASYGFRLPFQLDGVRMVGWIDADHDYPRGNTPCSAVSRLRELLLARDPGRFDLHVNVVRGISPCGLCGRTVSIARSDGKPAPLGMSEIWIPGSSWWYASPSLILHYIEEHLYRPPACFLDVLDKVDMSQRCLSQEEYDRAVRAVTAPDANS